MKKLLPRLAIWLIVVFVAIQFVPYGKQRTNPPVRQEPKWNSPRTRELVKRACFNCHSNETVWPWYSRIAPISWLVVHDVREGRSNLNFTEWDLPQTNADKAVDEIKSGDMPPIDYRLMHPKARLSHSEKEELIRGLNATFGNG